MNFRPLKPWHLFRPQQILHPLAASKLRPGIQPLPTSWGGLVYADPSKTIGRAIATTGLHDPAVTELVARLATLGTTIIDAGRL